MQKPTVQERARSDSSQTVVSYAPRRRVWPWWAALIGLSAVGYHMVYQKGAQIAPVQPVAALVRPAFNGPRPMPATMPVSMSSGLGGRQRAGVGDWQVRRASNAGVWLQTDRALVVFLSYGVALDGWLFVPAPAGAVWRYHGGNRELIVPGDAASGHAGSLDFNRNIPGLGGRKDN